MKANPRTWVPEKDDFTTPDMAIKGGRVLNVYTGEVLQIDVVIHGPWIRYVGPPAKGFKEARRVVQADGAFLIPGFFDPHAHTDILFNPASFSNQVILTGTTSVFSDSHDLAASLGPSGFERVLEDSKDYPVKFFSGVPAASPPFPQIDGGERFTTAAFRDLIKQPTVLGVSEITPWVRITTGNRVLAARIQMARSLGKRVEGHTVGASYENLNRLVDGGITSCHEALTWEDALARLRLGLFVMLRHGSIRSDLKDLSRLFTEKPLLSQNRVMLTPDTLSARDIMTHGYMDYLVAEAVQYGIDPVPAIRMATLNPASYFGLDHLLGGIAPGRIADLLLVSDLSHPTPHLVIEKGRLVARDQRLEIPPGRLPCPGMGERPFQIESIRPPWLEVQTAERGTARVPAIHIVDKTVTDRREATLSVVEGLIQPDLDQDILKVCLIQRSGKRMGKGFVSGSGFKGAFASSISHEVHDLMVIGHDSEDMRLAAEEVLRLKGGIVLAQNGRILRTLHLPIGGIMSTLPMGDLVREVDALTRVFEDMGSRLEDPLLTFGFLSFTSIIDLRITLSGVYSVKDQKVVFPCN